LLGRGRNKLDLQLFHDDVWMEKPWASGAKMKAALVAAKSMPVNETIPFLENFPIVSGYSQNSCFKQVKANSFIF
jgi:hypothetical protein